MRTYKSLSTISLLILISMLSACATDPLRPVLYPNDHLNTVGAEQGQAEIQACMAQAEEFGLDPKKDGQVGKKAGQGATMAL